jgi:hypothetical protein
LENGITFPITKNGEMRTVHIPDPLPIELAKVPDSERTGLCSTAAIRRMSTSR